LKSKFAFILLFILFLSGCTPENNLSEGKKEIDHDERINVENKQTATLNDKPYEFTYLEDLSEERLAEYHNFLKDGNINHLTNFAPEQIVLIYMNLVLEHDVEKIYALTYDNGNLPSLDLFSREYEEYLSQLLTDDYLKYRFYDSIQVVEDTRKHNDVAVKIQLSFGGHTNAAVAYGLKKDKNVWKMDLYYWIEKAKKDT
jgi:hypothetical protein